MFDRERDPWLVLQDASGDVAALCGRIGNTNNGISYVAAQWTWDAYGNVFSADHIAPHPFMSVGHKGLFVERLDVGVADASVPGSQVGDTPRLVPFAQLVYHNRNRSYNPQLGRFLQADPNASGMVVHGDIDFHGEVPFTSRTQINLQQRLADGANLFQYLGSAPSDNADPLGLYMWGDNLDTLHSGATAFLLADMLVDTHRFVQDELIDWALDWSRGDDEADPLVELAYSISRTGDEMVDVIAGPNAQFIQANVMKGMQKLARSVGGRVGRGMSAKITAGFRGWLNKGKADKSVYMLVDKKTGKAKGIYTGISNDTNRREVEHKSTFGADVRLQELERGLTRNQARSIEQALIRKNPHLANDRNSIAPDYQYAKLAQEFADDFMKARGIKTRW